MWRCHNLQEGRVGPAHTLRLVIYGSYNAKLKSPSLRHMPLYKDTLVTVCGGYFFQ